MRVDLEANMRHISKDFCQKLNGNNEEDYICQIRMTNFTAKDSITIAHFQVIASKPCPSTINVHNLLTKQIGVLEKIVDSANITINQCKYLVHMHRQICR